ncbi:MAG: ABC transporter permease [Deltaproteobacteria bacterium]|nr:ABC transporter permease [Deltaproteobacteria bacterium]
MRLSLYSRAWVWESRGAFGRLAFFGACLAVGVAAVVAVAGLSDGVEQALRAEARNLLAADLQVEGHRPLPTSLSAAVAAVPGARWVEVRQLPTVAAAPGRAGAAGPSELVELKAVGPGYPFYGTLQLEPRRALSDLLTPDAAVVAPELLERLGLRVGGHLLLGGAAFRVVGTVDAEPDRIAFSLTLGPRVFVSLEGLRRTGLETLGSRIEYRALVALPAGVSSARAEAVANRLRAALPDPSAFRVQTYTQAQPNLRRALDRGTRFLGLVALLSLLIGGIGVAQTVRAWLAERIDSIAVLQCLGVRPREILALYLGHTALVAMVGSAVGAAAGVAVQAAAGRLAQGLLPASALRLWQPAALLRGMSLGVGVALLFSLPLLMALRRVPPVRVLRHDAEPLPPSRWAQAATVLALAGGVLGTAWAQSGSAAMGAEFTAGLAGAVLILGLAARAAARLAAAVPERWVAGRVSLRHGLGALARPGAGTLGAVVGLGLGVLLVLAMYLVQARLGAELGGELPRDAPTAFLLDVQPDQWAGVRTILEAKGATRIDSVPVVMARLKAVDGRSVAELASKASTQDGERGRRRWVFTREQRLTYLRALPPGNEVVEGRLWSDPRRPEVSVEDDFARDLGARLGSTLTFDVQGVPLDLEVTSLRRVEWRTFGINFFLVVEPGVLESAPQFRLVSARLPPGGEQRAQDLLAARYPNVTLLKVRAILEKILAVLNRVALGVQFLGGFTVVAGIAILAGAVSAGSVRRGREVALLKTLGMTRRGVAAAFALEYALVGAVAGLIGSAGAGVAAWAVLTRGMEIPFRLDALPYAAAVAASVLLAVTAGLAASGRALGRRPVDVLRAE